MHKKEYSKSIDFINELEEENIFHLRKNIILKRIKAIQGKNKKLKLLPKNWKKYKVIKSLKKYRLRQFKQ
jgi:hypothetical protein